jgi:hypothetical protein
MRSAIDKLAAVTVAALCFAACEADPPATGEGSAPEDPSEAPPSPGPNADDGAVAAGDDAGAPDADPSGEPTPPPDDEPPADWGQIKPPVPPPDPAELTVHALVGYEVVAVYSQPNLESPRLGYLRFGQRAMVTPKIEDAGEGCRKGFHALAAGGFACASKGLIVDADKEPYMYLPPPPPRTEEPLPYDYGTIAADGTAMWWRIADRDEVTLAQEKYDAMVAALEPPAAAPPSKPKPKPAAGTPDAPALPGVTDTPAAPPVELTEEEREKIRLRKEAERLAEEERAAQLAEKAKNLPLNSAKPFMEKGFTITLGDKVKEKGRSWWRTTRGGFVESSKTWKKKTYDFEGSAIAADSGFPFGFVMEEEASASMLTEDGKLKRKRKLEYREFLDFAEEVEIDGTKYLVTADGLHVRAKDVRLAEPATRPEGLKPWEKWIDVDLGRQILVAYEGEQPVYATLVSTGKKGTAEESFETPTGSYRIDTKHISSSMDGSTASDGNYSIQDVPWAMFFKDSYALHGAFWHSRFGNRRSHGCVNLGPTDARWMFNWTTPILPEGWHGVKAHEGAPGTLVVIR